MSGRGFEQVPDLAVGERRTGADRRTFLKVAGAGGAGLVLSSALGVAPAQARPFARKRAYVLVIDGCRPDEIGGGLMPATLALRRAGLNFPRARSLPIMETIPNHVMMMTGVRPDRSGVPANSIYDRTEQVVRDLDRPTDLRADTLIEQVNRSGGTTGTVLSKDYLYGIFGTRATHRWEPAPLLPITDHAPDLFSMAAAKQMVTTHDPDLMFINLGDVDRVGHSDITGSTLGLARAAALVNTDLQVRGFVNLLKWTGRWPHSMVIVLADHSMDWSLPHKVISLQDKMDADPLLAGQVEIAQNGGADLLYWTGGASAREAAVARMIAVARAQDGVLVAHDRLAEQSTLRLGGHAGDVVVYCRAGWRFSDPNVVSNPIPGNHGHPATEPIPFFVTGGHPEVPRGSSTAPATTQDVAPTASHFLGLVPPSGAAAWDGERRI